jgi:Spy/CpxP family protein refolding chaperone
MNQNVPLQNPRSFLMKWNIQLLRTGIIVFAVATTPLSVQAQPQQANQDFPALENVDLTPQQKDQLDQIRKDSRAQIVSTLTPEQKSQLEASLQQGGDLKTALSGLNLSPEQDSKLKEVQQSNREKVKALLTPEQKQKIRQQRSFGGR